MTEMRVLVTGASGFLGYHLVRYFEEKEISVLGLWRTTEPVFEKAHTRQVDLTDTDQVQRTLLDWSPTHIIHCAALSSTAECEANPQKAFQANFSATQILVETAKLCMRQLPHFIFISTDLVFDGNKGYYSETDLPAPIMVYGKTKRAAEELVEMSYEGDWCIVRSALIYGVPAGTGKGGFLLWLLKDIARSSCTLFEDEFRSPVYMGELCWLIGKILSLGKTGIWHAGGRERLSRYEIGLAVARAFSLPVENVQRGSLKNAVLAAPRPADVSLNISKACQELGYAPRTFTENLELLRSHMTP